MHKGDNNIDAHTARSLIPIPRPSPPPIERRRGDNNVDARIARNLAPIRRPSPPPIERRREPEQRRNEGDLQRHPETIVRRWSRPKDEKQEGENDASLKRQWSDDGSSFSGDKRRKDDSELPSEHSTSERSMKDDVQWYWKLSLIHI